MPDKEFVTGYLTVDGRDEWNKRAARLFENVNLVFMDPDNGLLVKSVKKHSARSVKYAFYDEVKNYIDAGKSRGTGKTLSDAGHL